MNAIIINNSTKNVNVNISCTDDSSLQDLKDVYPVFIGARSNSDVHVSGDCTSAKHIVIQVWDGDDVRGRPDSSLVYDTALGRIVSQKFRDYKITISSNDKGERIITLQNNGSSVMLYILLFLVILFVVIGMGIGSYYLFRYLRKNNSYSSVSNEDLPFVRI